MILRYQDINNLHLSNYCCMKEVILLEDLDIYQLAFEIGVAGISIKTENNFVITAEVL